jgi:predicted O-methyltransferase YrrM
MLRSTVRRLVKAARTPERVVLRSIFRARKRRQDPVQERNRLIQALAAHWGVDGEALSQEFHRSEFARWTAGRRQELEGFAGPRRGGTSSDFSGEALYLLVRAARPSVVVETGVLYGASSAHILAALDKNGGGELHSIDLGCPPEEPAHDFFVPQDLASRWTYIRGSVREELPPLLARLGTIDMFNHDSLHTYDNMTWEYERAVEHLRPGGVLSSHDVLVVHSLLRLFQPNAFPAFCQRHGLTWTTFGNSGFTVMPG